MGRLADRNGIGGHMQESIRRTTSYQEFTKTLSRGLPAEDFAGTLVEHFLIGAELLIRNQRQVGAFGQVVSDATILAFAGAPLPKTVRVTKEDLQSEVGRQQLVLDHFFALVVREGLEQGAGRLSSLRVKASRTLVASFSGRWQRTV